MTQQEFIAKYVADNAGKGRKALSVAQATAAAEREWARLQDPHAQFVSKLAKKGNYWASADGSKVRVYFNEVTVEGVGFLVTGFYDVQQKKWDADGCDAAKFEAAVLATV